MRVNALQDLRWIAFLILPSCVDQLDGLGWKTAFQMAGQMNFDRSGIGGLRDFGDGACALVIGEHAKQDDAEG